MRKLAWPCLRPEIDNLSKRGILNFCVGSVKSGRQSKFPAILGVRTVSNKGGGDRREQPQCEVVSFGESV
jgi:hypothetical protein